MRDFNDMNDGMNNTIKQDIVNFIKYQFIEHCGRTVGLIIGFIAALSILIFGFFTTLFVVICMALGLYIGNRIDNSDVISDDMLYKLERFLPPFSRRW